MMYLYGVGDHGGGPTRDDLDTALRWQKSDVVYPKLQFSTAADFFADLEKNQNELKLPTWDGELYFQYHRGVQTTQSETKSGNRQNEVLILNAEKLASIGSLFGATVSRSRIRFCVEEDPVQPVSRHPAGLGHRHQLRRCGAQVCRDLAHSATTRFTLR